MEKLFHNERDRLIRELGRRALDDKDVDDAGRAMFKRHWGGVYAHDSFPTEPRQKTYYVVNTGGSKGRGIHWMAVYRGSGRVIYIYDSFGRATGRVLPELRNRLEKAGFILVESDRSDAEQRGASEICGHLSLSWLEVIHRFGIKAALSI